MFTAKRGHRARHRARHRVDVGIRLPSGDTSLSPRKFWNGTDESQRVKFFFHYYFSILFLF